MGDVRMAPTLVPLVILTLIKWNYEMTDEELIAKVARVWVDGGGDAEGIDWCYAQLKETIQS